MPNKNNKNNKKIKQSKLYESYFDYCSISNNNPIPLPTPTMLLLLFLITLTSANNPSLTQLQSQSKNSTTHAHPASTAVGINYPSLTASLAIGTRGQLLLQDAFLLENIQSFNRERIPERVVHAKGAGAFGVFEVTQDVSKFTKAGFLQMGKKTRVREMVF